MTDNYEIILEKLKVIEQSDSDPLVIKEAKQIRLLVEDLLTHQKTTVESMKLENEYLKARCEILDNAIADVLYGRKQIMDEQSKNSA